MKELIFDEYSYKKYYVKCSAPPQIKFIPFSDLGDVLNYKGEGSVNLVAYYPYAESIRQGKIVSKTSDSISNIGDLEMPIKIYYPISSSALNVDITLVDELQKTHQLKIRSATKIETDSYICIDMKTHLIEGVDSNRNKTGHLYNRFITAGDFFMVPTGLNKITSTVAWNLITFNYLYY